tara:strand:- start:1958 stop:2926 length:969 start_codon:yes stop_codon:yes gene_type:complete
MSSSPIIDLRNVRKTFGRKVQALRGVDLSVNPGEVFGLLGPNGAGKSTLVKILMTVIRPDGIEGTLLGKPIGHKPSLARVGYLPEHHHFPDYLTGRQVIRFSGAMTGMRRVTRNRNADRLLERVGMSSWADKRLKSYSKGMLQRIGLAQAMVNEPDLIVLDEPTDGVDPVGRREIRDLLLELRDEGKTIFLNSHLLSELEMVCDQVAIMVKGEVAMHGAIDDLTLDSRRFEIDVQGTAPDWFDAMPNTTVSTHDETTRIVLRTDQAEEIQPLIDRLRSEHRTIIRITPVQESLEDLFMRAVTEDDGTVQGPGGVIKEGRGRQ